MIPPKIFPRYRIELLKSGEILCQGTTEWKGIVNSTRRRFHPGEADPDLGVTYDQLKDILVACPEQFAICDIVRGRVTVLDTEAIANDSIPIEDHG